MLKKVDVSRMSMWTESVSEPIPDGSVKIHGLAILVYVAAMIAYIVFAAIDWVNFERPVLFSSQETKRFDAVALNFTIDCQDCRRFLRRNPDGSLWKISWDYSGVTGGCAARSPGKFDEELRAFCAAQHDAAPAREYYQVPFAACSNGFDIILPWSTSPFQPFGVTPTTAACQAKCDTTPGCVGYQYADASFSAPSPTGGTVTFPRGACLMARAQTCYWFNPTPTTEIPLNFFYLKMPYGQPSTPLSDPLDKCTITSNDVAMFRQRGSDNPLVAATSSTPMRSGYGWNPNYIGPRPQDNYTACGRQSACFEFGPATPDRGFGSLYELKYEVPLCHTSDDSTNTANSDLTLELSSIPHHAFAGDGVPIGQAVVTLSSGSTFTQENRFQPWHKNTLHLGLTVERDESEAITKSEPWFTNFQYDGRVNWGKEEDHFLNGVADTQQMMKMALGVNYDGITLDQAIAIDAGLLTGSLTLAQVAAMNSTQLQGLVARNGQAQIDFLRNEYQWRDAARGTVTTGLEEFSPAAPSSPSNHGHSHGRRLETEADVAVAVGGEGEASSLSPRRRLNDHDEWGGVLLTIKMGRFANVYTDGAKPTVYGVIASVGGASGSLVGLIGLGIVVLEMVKLIGRKLCGGPPGVEPLDEKTRTPTVVVRKEEVRELHERDASPPPPPRRVQSVSPGGNA